MIGRLLLWLLLGLIAWWMLRPRRAAPPASSRANAPAGTAPEAMVDCAHCGLHFPASEAVRDGARVFCCSAHRDAGPRRDA
jgi:uncharacterized protein